jgi:predicted site-specific integrase-resolvase
MKIYKITGASDYLGVSINTLRTLANNGRIKSFLMEFKKEDMKNGF